MRGWTATTLATIERVPLPEEGVRWLPIRAHLGIASFGVNAWSGDADTQIIGAHDETDDFAGGHEELYLVLAGRASFTIGEEAADAPAGTLVFVRDRALRRGAVALEDGTVVLSVGGRPGTPFAVAPWEYIVRAGACARASDWAGAIEQVGRGLERHPESAELLYHRACYESRAGRLADARTHLDAAIARDPRNAERAARDPDFEPLRSQ